MIVTPYPNPYRATFKLNINTPVSGMATIECYTITGIKVYELKTHLFAGKSNVTEVKSLSSVKTAIIYKVSIGKHQTNGIILRPSE